MRADGKGGGSKLMHSLASPSRMDYYSAGVCAASSRSIIMNPEIFTSLFLLVAFGGTLGYSLATGWVHVRGQGWFHHKEAPGRYWMMVGFYGLGFLVGFVFLALGLMGDG